MWKSWEDFDDKNVDWIHGEGSAVLEIAYLLPYEYEYGKWHRSKDTIEGNPFTSSMINKKWWLEEELNNHLLQFQQVKVGSPNIIILNILGRFDDEGTEI